jgi:hypothetical protein
MKGDPAPRRSAGKRRRDAPMVGHSRPRPRRRAGRRSPPRRGRHEEADGPRCSSARWASSPAGPRKQRDRPDHGRRKVEVEEDRGDRHRDIHRAAACPRRVRRPPSSVWPGCDMRRRRPPRSSTSSRIRSVRGSVGRCSGWPKPASTWPAPPPRMCLTAASAAFGRRRRRSTPPGLHLSKPPAAQFRRAEDHAAAAEDPGRQRSIAATSGEAA